MKFIIRGKNLEVTDSIKSYIEEKIGKLDKYFEKPGELTANVIVRVKGKDQIVEVTIPAKKIILRGEESNEDLYASIDLVSDKLERQIKKNKAKMNNMKGKKMVAEFNFDVVDALEDEKEKLIAKRKDLEMKPMSEEEAILQMELLGHDFFIFKNDNIDQISVVYKRKEGNYGIINTK
ncbi:MAG: ribosome-associated translation inhibitor RaiA [Bacilli bacterium]|nr:ribosome-associated translation inhibitor RaiA [Bacilli bacterium]